MKPLIAAALVALTALGANAQDAKKPDSAKAGCTPPPKELVVKEVQAGTGDRSVIANSAVLMNYTGWIYDGCAKDFKGEKFDTTEARGTPFGFMVGVGKVIKGWDEGVVGMKEKDAKRVLIIPADKGYGEKGTPDGKIPPNSALVFEVQTIKIIYYPGAITAEPGAVPMKPGTSPVPVPK